jgi:hypothetical protein|tara:strand:- start:14554 stop:14835 length:282 start_codon:yes stop_codon:yes gene_type:complete
MTILEMMERANTRETRLATAFIKDAIVKIQSTYEVSLDSDKQDITKDKRDYSLPTKVIALDSVSILDIEDGNKYKRIRRLTHDPLIAEDKDLG